MEWYNGLAGYRTNGKGLVQQTHEQIQFVACDTVGTVVGYSIKHSDTLWYNGVIQ